MWYYILQLWLYISHCDVKYHICDFFGLATLGFFPNSVILKSRSCDFSYDVKFHSYDFISHSMMLNLIFVTCFGIATFFIFLETISHNVTLFRYLFSFYFLIWGRNRPPYFSPTNQFPMDKIKSHPRCFFLVFFFHNFTLKHLPLQKSNEFGEPFRVDFEARLLKVHFNIVFWSVSNPQSHRDWSENWKIGWKERPRRV